MSKVIKVKDMIPKKWESKTRFRWVFEVEGIDAFLLKSVTRPEYRRSKGEKKLKSQNVKFELYDPIAPSGAQQVMEWIRETNIGKKGRRNGKLKLIDAVGTIVETWNLNGMKLVNVDFGGLRYDDSSLTTIKVEASYKKATLEY